MKHLWKLQGFNSALVSRPKRSKIDQSIGIWMGAHAVLHLLINRNQNFFVAPVKLLFVIAAETD